MEDASVLSTLGQVPVTEAKKQTNASMLAVFSHESLAPTKKLVSFDTLLLKSIALFQFYQLNLI